MDVLRLVSLVVALFVAAGPAGAETRYVQLSLLNPVQVFPEQDSIEGVRVNLFYGRNASLTGVDVGWIAGHLTGDLKGVQWNLANIVEGDAIAWQAGLLNVTEGSFAGYQLGIYNRTKGPSEGLQVGWVNMADDAGGVQLGLVNYTRRMRGLQIGLVNVISSKEKLPVLPLVNWSF